MTEETPHLCLYCSNLLGCPIVVTGDGPKFDLSRAVTSDHYWECDRWREASEFTKTVRDNLYNVTGNNALATVAIIPLSARKEGEVEYMEAPDLASIISQGMTSDEREQQLRFTTDDQGAIQLAQDGQPIARPSLELRAFAVSEDYHVRLPKDVGYFETLDKIIKHIIASEIEQGFIVKSKRSPKKAEQNKKEERPEMSPMGKTVNLRPAVKPIAKAAAAPAAKPGPKPMATVGKPSTGPKPLVRQGVKPAAAPAAQASVRPHKTAPAAGVPSKAFRRPGAPVKAPEPEPEIVEEVEEAAEASGVDSEALAQAVAQAVVPLVAEAIQPMIDGLAASFTEMREMFVDVMSIDHDVRAQQFQALAAQMNAGMKINPQLDLSDFAQVYATPGKILAYLDEKQVEEVAEEAAEATGEEE